jgi:hypothetical protein
MCVGHWHATDETCRITCEDLSNLPQESLREFPVDAPEGVAPRRGIPPKQPNDLPRFRDVPRKINDWRF